MIKDTELRKGNLLILNVNFKEVVHRVDEIYADEVKVTSIEDSSSFPRMALKTCKPIHLTPEWLERCGLKQKPIEPDDLPQWQNLNMNIAQYTDGFYLYTVTSDPWHDQAVGKKIEYVHTLQNISLDLFGEELKIELP